MKRYVQLTGRSDTGAGVTTATKHLLVVAGTAFSFKTVCVGGVLFAVIESVKFRFVGTLVAIDTERLSGVATLATRFDCGSLRSVSCRKAGRMSVEADVCNHYAGRSAGNRSRQRADGRELRFTVT